MTHDVCFQGAQDGCTATACLVRGSQLWIANTGDSRTVLVKQASVVQVTTDHKPDEPGEKARIVAAGGTVEYVFGVWRVNGMHDFRVLVCCHTSSSDCASGSLAMSRSLGDASLKPIVVATPDVFPRSKEADDVAIVRFRIRPRTVPHFFLSPLRFFVPTVFLTRWTTSKSQP